MALRNVLIVGLAPTLVSCASSDDLGYLNMWVVSQPKVVQLRAQRAISGDRAAALEIGTQLVDENNTFQKLEIAQEFCKLAARPVPGNVLVSVPSMGGTSYRLISLNSATSLPNRKLALQCVKKARLKQRLMN